MAERNLILDNVVLEQAFVNGLRREPANPTNSQFLAQMRGMIPTSEGAIRTRTVALPASMNDPTVVWPNPRLLRGERLTILADETTVSTVDEATWVSTPISVYQAQDATMTDTIPAGGDVWQFVSFGDLLFMTKGNSLIFKAPHIHTTRFLHEDAQILVETLAKQDNRLILGGLSGTFTSDARWLEIFQHWRQTTDGKTFTTDQDTFNTHYLVWSEEGGGAEDVPFAAFLSMFGLPTGATYDDTLKEVVIDAIEKGEIGMFPLQAPGGIKNLINLGNDLISFGDNTISRLTRTEDGYDETRVLNVGVFGRTSVGGTDNEIVFIDSQAALWRWTAGQGPQRLGYIEYMNTMTPADVVVSYDPEFGEYWITDGTNGFILTPTGLGSTVHFPTSLLRDDANNLVGVFKLATNPNSDQISNGDFPTNATDWTLESNWAWGSGDVDKTPGDTNTMAQLTGDMTTPVVAATWYEVNWEVKNRTAGGIVASFGEGGVDSSKTALIVVDGNNRSFLLVDGSSTDPLSLYFTPDTAFDGSIDNVTVQLVYADIYIETDAINAGTMKMHELREVKIGEQDFDPRGFQVLVNSRTRQNAAYVKYFEDGFRDEGIALVKVSGIDFRIVLYSQEPTDDSQVPRLEFTFSPMGKRSLGKLLNPPA